MTMHDAAFAWLADRAGAVLEDWEWPAWEQVGTSGTPQGLDVGAGGHHGHKVQALFKPMQFATVDWNPDTEPDVVADMTVMVLPEGLPAEGYPLVLCTEVLEHVPAWRALLFNCVRLVAPGGHLLVTCAGPGREPHSGLDGGPLRPEEAYRNIEPFELVDAISNLIGAYSLVWRQFTHNTDAHDLYLHMQSRRRPLIHPPIPEEFSVGDMIPPNPAVGDVPEESHHARF
jgi:SAM-dependent methyltransferase